MKQKTIQIRLSIPLDDYFIIDNLTKKRNLSRWKVIDEFLKENKKWLEYKQKLKNFEL